MQKELIQPFILETGLSEAIAQRIFVKFFGSLPMELDQITAAVNQKDWLQAGMLAHTLKGSSSNLRLMDLSSQASLLDVACRNHQAATAQAHLADLITEVAKAQARYAET